MNPKNTQIHKSRIRHCPLGVDVSKVLESISAKDFKTAFDTLFSKNPFPGVCGCLCSSLCTEDLPEEFPPMSRFESFLSSYAFDNKLYAVSPPVPHLKKKKIALVGAGPSSLMCAHDLAMSGYPVFIFDERSLPGGMMDYAVSPERLPRHILFSELGRLQRLGVAYHGGVTISEKTMPIRTLRSGFDAIYLGIGSRVTPLLHIPGIQTGNVTGVFDLFGLLGIPDSLKNIRNVVVIGGGNCAFSLAIELLSRKFNVAIVDKNPLKDLPADTALINASLSKGVELLFSYMPSKILSRNNSVSAIECRRVTMDESQETYITIDADLIVIATGLTPKTFNILPEDIQLTKDGYIKTDQNGMTNIDGVFAGGDAVNPPRGFIEALADGRKKASDIKAYLENSVKPKQAETDTTDRKKILNPNPSGFISDPDATSEYAQRMVRYLDSFKS